MLFILYFPNTKSMNPSVNLRRIIRNRMEWVSGSV